MEVTRVPLGRSSRTTDWESLLQPKPLQAKSTVLRRVAYKGCLFTLKLNTKPEP